MKKNKGSEEIHGVNDTAKADADTVYARLLNDVPVIVVEVDNSTFNVIVVLAVAVLINVAVYVKV